MSFHGDFVRPAVSLPPQSVISFALTKEFPKCPDAGFRCRLNNTRAPSSQCINGVGAKNFAHRREVTHRRNWKGLKMTNETLTQFIERRSTMWQKSRNWKARLGLALGLALVACSVTYAQDVRTNYMPGTDFSKYHTYAWVDEVKGVPQVGGQPDQILDTQVKQAVDSQMAAKGLTGG